METIENIVVIDSLINPSFYKIPERETTDAAIIIVAKEGTLGIGLKIEEFWILGVGDFAEKGQKRKL